ncbi:MAG: hypothetical protein EPN23_09135 [Verrucomicrobia bacterium]|nr:MAG: hypothetical protein EPN23_09135 [Verrucomicrobiota bacterium]
MKMKWLGSLLLASVLASAVAGCRWSRDEDHTPPAGMGSIMVRNNTGDDIDVYLNGTATSNRADYSSTTPYDLQPGTYRVALSEHNGYRSYAGFVDVLVGRLTFMDVTVDFSDRFAYDVVIFFN